MPQAGTGDVQGAIQRLTDFLTVPEVTINTDPEVQAARRWIKELLRDLQDRGADKMSRKQMRYGGCRWSGGRGRSGT